MKKVLLFLSGAVLIAFGVVVLCNREMILFSCGLGLLIYGVGTLITWSDHRKTGTANKWSLWIALAACIAGVAVFVGGYFEIVAVGIVMLIIGLWLIGSGVLEIIGAVMYRKAMTSVELGVQAPGSVGTLVLGAVMIAVGVLVLFIPRFAVVATGFIVAVAMIVVGIRLLAAAFSIGAISQKEDKV